MSAELQIISLAGEGANVHEIAAELQMEPAAVEYTLRKNHMLKDEEISDDDFDRIRDGLIEMALNSENDFVRARCSTFLYERKKGKLRDLSGAPQVNVQQLNVLIANSHKRILNGLRCNISNEGGTTVDVGEEQESSPEGKAIECKA